MYPKRSGQDGPDLRQVRSSDRIKTRPNIYGRPYLFYNQNLRRSRKNKNKTRTAASQIAKMLRPGNRKPQDSNTNVSVLYQISSRSKILVGMTLFIV